MQEMEKETLRQQLQDKMADLEMEKRENMDVIERLEMMGRRAKRSLKNKNGEHNMEERKMIDSCNMTLHELEKEQQELLKTIQKLDKAGKKGKHRSDTGRKLKGTESSVESSSDSEEELEAKLPLKKEKGKEKKGEAIVIRRENQTRVMSETRKIKSLLI